MNRDHIQEFRDTMVSMHNLSIRALLLKDKENYRACNTVANEAFGKYFFNMITLGAATLWPVPVALAWMDARFSGIAFELLFPVPILGESVGFAAVMILIYILCRFFRAWMKRGIFSPANEPAGATGGEGQEEMIRMKDVEKHGGLPESFWYSRTGTGADSHECDNKTPQEKNRGS